MNQLRTKIIAVATLLSLAVSSMASEGTTVAYSLRPSPNPAPLTASLVLPRKAALNRAELTNYQEMAENSKLLAAREVAGADNTIKTVVIVVGVVVVVVSIAAMTTYGPGSLHTMWH